MGEDGRAAIGWRPLESGLGNQEGAPLLLLLLLLLLNLRRRRSMAFEWHCAWSAEHCRQKGAHHSSLVPEDTQDNLAPPAMHSLHPLTALACALPPFARRTSPSSVGSGQRAATTAAPATAPAGEPRSAL